MKARIRPPRRIPDGKLVAIDTEATGLHYWCGDQPYAIAFCNEVGDLGYFDWPVDPFERTVKYDPVELAVIEKWMRRRDVTKVWFNGKFDRGMIREGMKIVVRGPHHEVQFAAHVCNSSEKPLALKPLSEKYLDYPVLDRDLLKEATSRARRIAKKKGWTLHQDKANGKSKVEPDYWMVGMIYPELAHLVRDYCCGDTQRTMLLHLMYQEALQELGQTASYAMEMELDPVVERMEARGICFSPEENTKLRQQCLDDQYASYAELQVMSGRQDFNPKSPDQVRALLYQGADALPRGLLTKTGQLSTAYKYVQLFKDRKHVQSLLRYKSAQKGLTVYFKVFDNLKCLDPNGETYTCHPNYRQVGPKTSRFSSGGAGNLQNIPDGISTRAGKTVRGRDIFGPRPDYRWYLADYSQLEVRIFADLSQEAVLLDALAHNRDIHTECANKAWGNEKGLIDSRATLGLSGTLVNQSNYHEYQELQRLHREWGWTDRMLFGKLSVADQTRMATEWLEHWKWDIVAAESDVGMKHARAKAKILLFCRMFGGGPNAIKDLLYVTREQAERFLKDYAAAFPRMTEFIDEVTKQARADGYVLTNFGRRLVVPADKPYKGVNYRVQGSAAGLLKTSMVKIDDYFWNSGLDVQLLLTIHDEIVFEIRKDQASKGFIRGVKTRMEDHGGVFGVPMPVEISRTDKRWPDKKKLTWLHGV